MVNMITNHLDVWSSAQIKKNTVGRGSNGKQTAYGIKKLRELILELAVRGKLVPQDPNDEPASVLLEKIAHEKALLVKEGKIKNQKSLSEISDDEKPFDLPQGWEWARLGDLLQRISNGFSGNQNKNEAGYPFSRIETISNSLVNMKKIGYSSRIDPEKLDYYRLHTGDILLSHINSDFHVGKTAVVPKDIELYHGVNLLLLRLFSSVLSTYIDLNINTLRLSGYFIKIAQHAIGQSSINQSKIIQVCIALPPLAEQHRIVAKVNELMALCDQLEQQQTDSNAAHQTLVEILLGTLTSSADQNEFVTAWQRIADHFDTLFTTEHSIDQLKQTILQLAVMGKLVSQDPNDEPANVLQKKISERNSQLVKDGKIKKSKPLLQISKEKMPFELPPGWNWIKLGDVHDVTSSKRIHAKDYEHEGVPFFRSKEIGELGRGKQISTEIYIARDRYEELMSLPGFPKSGDMMLASIGASIGNNWICDERKFYYKDGNITKIGSHAFANMRFLQIFMHSQTLWYQVTNEIAGSAYNALTIEKIKELLFPHPPLAEQHRIVAKVDELMALCDALKTRINEAQTTQINLADVIVEQAVV